MRWQVAPPVKEWTAAIREELAADAILEDGGTRLA
jgi:hypothetical protein